MRCDLVIPALNEASNIDALFDALEPLRGTILRHIVLADNGSTDSTADRAAARGAVVVHEPARGYGAACLQAIEWLAEQDTPPETVAFLDADLSDDPAALPALLAPIEQGRAQLVIGSRPRRAAPGALTFGQRVGNRLACRLMAMLTGRRYRDLGPFRALRWSTLERLQMTDRTWGWTIEMQTKAALLGIPTLEVDVPYRRRASGRSKISGSLRGAAAAGTKIIWTIISVWWRNRKIRDE
ncbi:MAG: glycosyltransferase family 2 protein [Planctomycetota bacterium]